MEFKVDVDGPFTQSPSGTSSLTPSIDLQPTETRQVTMWRLPTTAPALSSALMLSSRLVVLLTIHGIQGRCRWSSQSPSGTASLTPSIDLQPTETRQVTMWRLPTTAPALSSALMISDRLVVLLRIHGIQGRCRWASHLPSGTSSLTPSIDLQPTETRQVTMWQLPTTAPALSSALMISDRLVVLLRIHGIQGGCRWASHLPSGTSSLTPSIDQQPTGGRLVNL